MAEDPKQTPIIPSQPPVVDTVVKDGGLTSIGGERLKEIPDVNLSPETKPFVHVESQPGDQISLENPLTSDRTLEINRASDSSLGQPQTPTTQEPAQTSDKIISFEDAAKKVREGKSILPPVPAKKDSTYWLSVLKVKSQAWLNRLRKKQEKEERLAA